MYPSLVNSKHYPEEEELRKGELHENVVRKDFLPDEHIAIKRELEPELSEEAQERMKAGKPALEL
jgi:hypothetical protein